ncbi:hypothetical protein Tco_0836611 [Tanacetum coccineum]
MWRAALANLVANLTLDTEENKKILKQLKKADASLTQELKECKSNLEESNTTRDSCLIALQSKQTELETYKTLIDHTVDYDKLERKLNETLGLLAQKEIDIKEGLVKEKTKVITDLKLKEEKNIDKMISMEKQLKFLNEIVYKRNQSIQTIQMLAPKGPTFNGRPTFANPMYLKKAQSEKPCLYEIPYDTSDLANRFTPDRQYTLNLKKESRSKLDKYLVKPYDYTKQNSFYENFKPASKEYHDQLAHANKVRKNEMHVDLKYVESLEKGIDELESDKQIFKHVIDLLLQECVSKDVMCSYLHSLSDLDAHTELQCLYLHKVKECECLAQKLSKQTETVSKEVYNELYASFAKLRKTPISLNFSFTTIDSENLDKMKEKGDPCILVGYSTQSNGYRVYNKRTQLIVESIHLRFDEIKEMSETYNSSVTTRVGSSIQSFDNSKQQDTPPTTNIQSSTEPITLTTNVNAEENNDNQAEDTQFRQDNFINPFCTPAREVAESSSRNIDNSNMHTFYQPHDSEYK